MPLVELLGLTDADFRAAFRKSPIKRLKRRGLLRNVCVALGNTGTPERRPRPGTRNPGPRAPRARARGVGAPPHRGAPRSIETRRVRLSQSSRQAKLRS